MVNIKRASRILMYSHDTFGLGHLRRTRAIAHALVRENPNLSVLILTGSPIIGSFDFSNRVDFVRIPGVIKLRNGDYTALKLHMDIEETLAMRASIIKHTAEAFDPDLFIVDKEPLGLRGEVSDTLHMLKDKGVPLVLGLRDVMDDPDLLEPEWERKGAMPALENLYDEIWVYGLPQICKPLEGMPTPESVIRKMVYTGYLEREVPDQAIKQYLISKFDPPYVLVTPGGGGDGESMVDWVIRAYESQKNLPFPALIVFGPFMQSEQQTIFLERIEKLPNVEALTFDAHMEGLMDNAAAVVAMGGYNTFCEILSFNKPAMIIPRTRPRMEQFIRASSAQSLGLISMLEDDGERRPETMATALRQLPQQKPPSNIIVPGLLSGLDSVNRLTNKHLDARNKNPSDRQDSDRQNISEI